MLQVLIAFFEGETTMVPRNAKWVKVESIEEASKKVRECLDENGLGMRDWFGGIVRDEKKNPVAVIQYNGRVGTIEDDAQFIKNAAKLMKKP